MNLLEELVKLQEAGETFVLSTIVKAEGSTPRSLGTKMIVLPQERTIGTIGGGKLEYLAVQDARRLLAERQCALKHYELEHEGLGKHCGGSIDVFHEVYTASPQIIILGAGHVAQPLAGLVADLGLPVKVIDPRQELVSTQYFSKAGIELICEDYLSGLEQCRLNSETICFIVSLGHEKEILKVLLTDDIKYAGVLGSRRKILALREQLLHENFSEEQWAKVRGPVGLDLGGETPYEVALSIVAELVTILRQGTGRSLNLENKTEGN